jgi:hypothetical protein
MQKPVHGTEIRTGAATEEGKSNPETATDAYQYAIDY